MIKPHEEVVKNQRRNISNNHINIELYLLIITLVLTLSLGLVGAMTITVNSPQEGSNITLHSGESPNIYLNISTDTDAICTAVTFSCPMQSNGSNLCLYSNLLKLSTNLATQHFGAFTYWNIGSPGDRCGYWNPLVQMCYPTFQEVLTGSINDNSCFSGGISFSSCCFDGFFRQVDCSVAYKIIGFGPEFFAGYFPMETTPGTINISCEDSLNQTFNKTVNLFYNRIESCIPNDSCATNTCIGSTCTNNCGMVINGTKECFSITINSPHEEEVFMLHSNDSGLYIDVNISTNKEATCRVYPGMCTSPSNGGGIGFGECLYPYPTDLSTSLSKNHFKQIYYTNNQNYMRHDVYVECTDNLSQTFNQRRYFSFEYENCIPNWTTSNWTICSNGNQTRTVIDLNSCGVTTGKPSIFQSCTLDCIPDNSCATSTCTTSTCTNNCGAIVSGTKRCSSGSSGGSSHHYSSGESIITNSVDSSLPSTSNSNVGKETIDLGASGITGAVIGGSAGELTIYGAIFILLVIIIFLVVWIFKAYKK